MGERTKAVIEIETAISILRSMGNTIEQLERWWPAQDQCIDMLDKPVFGHADLPAAIAADAVVQQENLRRFLAADLLALGWGDVLKLAHRPPPDL